MYVLSLAIEYPFNHLHTTSFTIPFNFLTIYLTRKPILHDYLTKSTLNFMLIIRGENLNRSYPVSDRGFWAFFGVAVGLRAAPMLACEDGITIIL